MDKVAHHGAMQQVEAGFLAAWPQHPTWQGAGGARDAADGFHVMLSHCYDYRPSPLLFLSPNPGPLDQGIHNQPPSCQYCDCPHEYLKNAQNGFSSRWLEFMGGSLGGVLAIAWDQLSANVRQSLLQDAQVRNHTALLTNPTHQLLRFIPASYVVFHRTSGWDWKKKQPARTYVTDQMIVASAPSLATIIERLNPSVILFSGKPPASPHQPTKPQGQRPQPFPYTIAKTVPVPGIALSCRQGTTGHFGRDRLVISVPHFTSGGRPPYWHDPKARQFVMDFVRAEIDQQATQDIVSALVQLANDWSMPPPPQHHC